MVIRGKIENLIYLAGILDGEGNFTIARCKIPKQRGVNPKYEPGITVVNTSKDLMEWLVTNIGGNYTMRSNKNSDKHKDTYQWKIGCVKFLEDLKLLIPYLVIKKRQAEIIVKFFEEKIPTPTGKGQQVPMEELIRRETLYQELRKEIDSRRPQRLNEGELIKYD